MNPCGVRPEQRIAEAVGKHVTVSLVGAAEQVQSVSGSFFGASDQGLVVEQRHRTVVVPWHAVRTIEIEQEDQARGPQTPTSG